jgi:hypothetical protein
VARADRSDGNAARPLYVDHPSAGKVHFEGVRRFLLDLGPGFIGDWRQLAMEVIHARAFL